MPGKDTLLEIVLHKTLPLIDGKLGNLNKRSLGRGWAHKRIGLLGRDVDVRLHKHKGIALQASGGRCENVAYSRCIGRSILDEECTIGTDACRILLKFLIAQSQ